MGLAPGALPDFPWDTLEPIARRAREHPDGIVDLSVGTPVDPTPAVVRDALVAAADAPGYPPTAGTPALRAAIVEWYARRRGVTLDPAGVLPTLGSKEFVALLPALLGLGAGDTVVHPEIAYPTYDVGARLAGATPLPADDVGAWAGRPDVRLVWLNSPSNPTGAILDVPALRTVVEAAREIGAVVASDECYATLTWADGFADGAPSVLDPRVTGDDHTGLLAVHSLSKQSSMAGYRAAWVAGDPALVGDLLGVRKHAGFMPPGPVQAAMVAALGDDDHGAAQRDRYARRRTALAAAFTGAGYQLDESPGGLYLWACAAGGQDGRRTAADLAELGLLVAPGDFYGPRGRAHVRVALTASDDDVARAVARLEGA